MSFNYDVNCQPTDNSLEMYFYISSSSSYSGAKLDLFDNSSVIDIGFDTSDESCCYIYSESSDSEIPLSIPVIGETASWPNGYFRTGSTPAIKRILANGEEIESATFTISEYSIASGTVVMLEKPTIGEILVVKKASTTLFSGVVMGYTYNIADNNYSIRIADVVSAKAYNDIIYTDGNPVDILADVIDYYGGTFDSDITTDEVFYSTEEEVSWTDLVKSVCLSLGAKLVYQPDGSYLLTDSFSTHDLSDSNVFADATATRELNVDGYKNVIYATIDDEWEEDWTEEDGETVDVFESLKLRITITRKGNQVTKITTRDKLTDIDTDEHYTYDDDGYLISYSMIEEGDDYKHTIDKDFTITDDNNYTYTIVEKSYEKWPDEETWREGLITTTDAEVHLDGVSTVEVIEQTVDREHYFENGGGDTFIPVNSTKKIYQSVDTGVSDDIDSEFAVKERTVCKSYTWQPKLISVMPWEYEYGWWFAGYTAEGSNQIEELTLTPAVVKYSISLKVSATDQNSVDALNKELDDSISLIGINNIDLLEEAAKNELRRRARVRTLKVETILAPSITPGDTVKWRDAEWTVTSVTHNPAKNGTSITAKQNSTLEELQVALEVITNSPITEILKAMKRQDALNHNATRGKIIEVLDNETYTVEVQK